MLVSERVGIEIMIRVRLRPRVRFGLRDMLGLELQCEGQSQAQHEGAKRWVYS